jgi:hypothetical protein
MMGARFIASRPVMVSPHFPVAVWAAFGGLASSLVGTSRRVPSRGAAPQLDLRCDGGPPGGCAPNRPQLLSTIHGLPLLLILPVRRAQGKSQSAIDAQHHAEGQGLLDAGRVMESVPERGHSQDRGSGKRLACLARGATRLLECPLRTVRAPTEERQGTHTPLNRA